MPGATPSSTRSSFQPPTYTPAPAAAVLAAC